MTNVKGIIVFYLTILIMVGGCATVRVETGGLPVPNHVVRGSIPSKGMLVDAAFIRFYGEKEGDEYLDTFEYLNPYAEEIHHIKLDHLRSLQAIVHVINPQKEHYQFVLYYEFPSPDGSADKQSLMRKKEILYKGNLSRKEFSIRLPANAGVTYKIWFELQGTDGYSFFFGPYMHYEVAGIPAETLSHSDIPNESRVIGADMDAPFREAGQ